MTHHFALVLVADGDVGVLHGDVLLDELALGLLGLGLSLGDGTRDDGATGDDLLGLGGAEAGLLGAGSGCAVSEAVRRSRRSRGAASVDGVVGTRLSHGRCGAMESAFAGRDVPPETRTHRGGRGSHLRDGRDGGHGRHRGGHFDVRGGATL